MKSTIGKVLAAAVAVVCTATLAACGSSGQGPNPSPSVVAGATPGGSLRIGISFDQPGLGMKDGDTYSGFDVDTAIYIAKSLGVSEQNISWVEADPANRENLLTSGAVDMVLSTYSITDERKKKVSFAGPYFIAGQDLLIRADDTSITGPDSLGGKTLCSVTGSTSAQNVKKQYPDVQLREFGTYSECVAALVAKGVDALTTDNTILAGYASQAEYAGKLKVVGKTFSTENYGIGLKLGNTDLCNKVTDAIKAMISDGSWQKAVDANLGPAGFKPGDGNRPTPAACS